MADGGAFCVFAHKGTCDLTGSTCIAPCGRALPEIEGLTYRDHFELFERRQYRKRDTVVRWTTIVLSVCAILVSGAHLGWQVFSENRKQETIEDQEPKDQPGEATSDGNLEKGSPD